MEQKNNKNYLWWLVVVIVSVALIFAVYFLWNNSKSVLLESESGLVNQPAGNQQVKDLKSVILPVLDGLRQYGNWPIANVVLSAGRGNPFGPSKGVNQPVATTSLDTATTTSTEL